MAMAINKNKMAVLNKLMMMDKLMAIYCISTNMPLVNCNEETFNDQVFVFENEELMKEFSAPYFQKKLPLRGVVFPKEKRMEYFNTLAVMNVDEIVFVEEEGRHIIQLSNIIKKKDFSNLPKEQRPVENPQLQLSGIYFAQEASRQVPNEQKENLPALEEELAANMTKANYIIPIVPGEGEGSIQEKIKANNIKVPMVKAPNGDMCQPICTDFVEFNKFAQGKKLAFLVAPFRNLDKMLVADAKAFMLNPSGYHLAMPKALIQGLKIRFGIEDDK